MLLGGDIGGTKTHLALFAPSGTLQMVRDKKYVSRDHKDLQSIIAEFLSEGKEKIERAAFGVAGPVVNGKCHTTNLPWEIDAEEISSSMKIPKVFLLNDLEANAWGIRCLKPEELDTINPGASQKGNQALLAAGTGLGEAGLYWDGEKHRPFSCEGGHVDFSPRNEEEIELLRFLQKLFGHVSFERLLSGPGLHNIYRFLTETGREKESEEIRRKMQEVAPPKVITDSAIKRQCPVCVRAVEWFVSIYGAEAGNLALKFLAVGGIYIGGGIAPKILPFLKTGSFFSSFIAKGRFDSLLKKIPIRVILNDNANLLGAGYYARNL